MSNHARELERALARLPASVLALLRDGRLSSDRAKRLSGLPEQDALRIATAGLGWLDFRAAVAAARRGRVVAQRPPPTLDDERIAERERRARHDARASLRRALHRIDELEETIAAMERFVSTPIEPIAPVRLKRGKRPAAAVALLSDVHAEERITRTDAIPNDYDLTIAQHRVGRFFAGTTWLTQHAARDFAIDTLVLWLGGDLITGDIHDELLEVAEVPPGEAMLRVRDWIVSGVRGMLEAMPETQIVIPCSYGNHGRTTHRIRHATGYGHSWEWALYAMIGHAFADEPRVRVHATRDEMQYLTVHDFTLAFHHGYNLRYNGGIGGLTIPAIKAMHRWQQWRDVDYYHFGHFHTSLDLGQLAFNGSVIGPSPYGFAIGTAPEEPRQSFYVLDDKRGKTHLCPVWVGE